MLGEIHSQEARIGLFDSPLRSIKIDPDIVKNQDAYRMHNREEIDEPTLLQAVISGWDSRECTNDSSRIQEFW